MKKVRGDVFETNSSSTHALVTQKIEESDYYPPGKKIAIKWTDTDGDYRYCTLRDKVSYLISHIADKYKWDVCTYEDLLDEIKDDIYFREIKQYLEDLGNYEIVFPAKFNGDIEDIVTINHQLHQHNLDDVLDDLLSGNSFVTKLSHVLDRSSLIELGRD